MFRHAVRLSLAFTASAIFLGATPAAADTFGPASVFHSSFPQFSQASWNIRWEGLPGSCNSSGAMGGAAIVLTINGTDYSARWAGEATGPGNVQADLRQPFGQPTLLPNGTLSKVTVNGATSIACGGGHTLLLPFLPTVSGVSPATDLTTGGATVVITGADFNNVTTVTFGGAAATSFTVDSATRITAVVPARPVGRSDVRVTTLQGASVDTAADDFVITAPAPPPAPVPTLSEWAMILLGLMLAGGAALHLQRQRLAL